MLDSELASRYNLDKKKGKTKNKKKEEERRE